MSILLEEPPAFAVKESWRDLDREFEVVNGIEVQLREMSAKSRVEGSRLARILSNYGLANGIGEAHHEVKIRLPTPVGNQRIPDVIFVSASKWPLDRELPDTDAWEILPELCVEILSPTDVSDDVKEKADEYFAAGVKEVWVIDPKRKEIQVFSSPKKMTFLSEGDVLKGGSILPGFELPITRKFPLSG